MRERGPQNRLLSALPGLHDGDELSVVTWEPRASIYRAGEMIESVYFPLDAVASAVDGLAGGSLLEVASVGREGMVGVGVILRTFRADHRTFVQVPGRALRLPARRLVELTERSGELDGLLHRYVQAFMADMARSALCSRAHPLDERIARWLLMTNDRVGRDNFPLTQELLGQTLGVARPRVSTAAATLQRAGYIRYRRGHLMVTDRPRLEEAACDCYRIVADAYDRLSA